MNKEFSQRLSSTEALELVQKDIHYLGQLAYAKRKALHQNRAYYIYNQHLNYTNICKNKCKFCAYYKDKTDKNSYTFSLEDIKKEINKRIREPIREIHIVGGLNPDLPLSYYEEMLSTIKALRPEAVIKAFTAVEIHFLAEKHQLSEEEVLLRLKKAGLSILPGGGAEVFAEKLRKKLCPEKISGQKWLEIHAKAHKLGIYTNCTLLFGHIESWEDRIKHLEALRDLQDQTRGFLCFIPLAYQPAHNELKAPGPDGIDFLKMIALSRLFLDNIPHIKTYWAFAGLKLSQVALYFGADDFDGTIVEEKIGHAAGADTPKGLTVEELKTYIRQAGFEPVNRNSFFEEVKN
ncbi:MAG TPA: aminofutalosine synthase MqnE [Desulfonauticus sp.]|nr:MAG: Radical SAM domain protein [Desulfonauticus sp. 38_4375]HCO11708.1 aminofutalosine synthase MqnE [Desulfonauticus sp.]